ncbi:hypothetical protein AAT19DRAFT_16822 [Rhodotorula toruloides]|uniref:Uncharacterized protein n=1 Tax=Rhodotorula toruloides TaxID=5286 RepID=A0A2T0A4F3_RHOTO|nr:hypothetical protein AAT19DRAFT_16822 [Rhodotorula toruloides]
MKSSGALILARDKVVAQRFPADPYSPSSAFLTTPAALAAMRLRCGTNNALCRSKGPAAPTNAQSFCISGSCTFRCNDGYAPGGPDGTQCVASQIQCGGTVCTIPQYGYATCNTDGTCNIGCEAGYERYLPNADSSGPYSCFDTLSDPSNCGMPGHACPDSYNGVGETICKNGECRISCPVGLVMRKAESVSQPYLCYGYGGCPGP